MRFDCITCQSLATIQIAMERQAANKGNVGASRRLRGSHKMLSLVPLEAVRSSEGARIQGHPCWHLQIQLLSACSHAHHVFKRLCVHQADAL